MPPVCREIGGESEKGGGVGCGGERSGEWGAYWRCPSRTAGRLERVTRRTEKRTRWVDEARLCSVCGLLQGLRISQGHGLQDFLLLGTCDYK